MFRRALLQNLARAFSFWKWKRLYRLYSSPHYSARSTEFCSMKYIIHDTSSWDLDHKKALQQVEPTHAKILTGVSISACSFVMQFISFESIRRRKNCKELTLVIKNKINEGRNPSLKPTIKQKNVFALAIALTHLLVASCDTELRY